MRVDVVRVAGIFTSAIATCSITLLVLGFVGLAVVELLTGCHRVVAWRQRKVRAAAVAFRRATVVLGLAVDEVVASLAQLIAAQLIANLAHAAWIHTARILERMKSAPGCSRIGGLEAVEFAAAFELRAGEPGLEQFDRMAQARESNRVGATRVFKFSTPAGVVAVIKGDPPEMHVGPEVGAPEQQNAFELAAGSGVPTKPIGQPATNCVGGGAGDSEDAAQRLHGIWTVSQA